MLQIDTMIADPTGPLPHLSKCSCLRDENLLESAQQACQKLQFRVAVAISTFQIANWEETTGREGLHLPMREVDGKVFPAYEMCVEQRTWLANEANRRRQSAREGIANYLAPELIGLIERHSRSNSTDCYMLAWDLMANFVELFAPLHSALVRSIATMDTLMPIPDLASTMLSLHLLASDWCPVEPQQTLSKRLQ